MNPDTAYGFSGIDLKVQRIRAGVRQYRVAQALGIPASKLCDYENGRRPVSHQIADTISKTIKELADQEPRGVDRARAA